MGLVGVNGIVRGFFIFLDIEQGMQFLHDSELLKTETICAKCSKFMKMCKSGDTMDKCC
jgi:hypothetical protein